MTQALFVAWRAGDGTRTGWGPVGKLEFDGQIYRFFYTQGARSLPGFQPFAEMRDLGQVYESDKLLPLFANRLLSASRPEYEAFLRWGGFDPDNPPDPIAILGVTEGSRQTDSIEVFPCPTPDGQGCYVNKFFLHGVRWQTAESINRISTLRLGEELEMVQEPSNVHDPNAMAVWTQGVPLRVGYVPRYLAREVGELKERCVPEVLSLSVERVNLDAPLQQRVLCRFRACWPEGFRPCAQADFEPIPSEASLLAR